MKRLSCIFIALFVAVSAHAAPPADTTATRLMPAFGADQASKLFTEFAPAPYTATFAATPAAPANVILGRVAIVPTAAANAAGLLKPTPQVGDFVTIFNSGPNAVRIKAGGAATINGSSAGGYIPLATQQGAECLATGSAAWFCALNTVPTPAGP